MNSPIRNAIATRDDSPASAAIVAETHRFATVLPATFGGSDLFMNLLRGVVDKARMDAKNPALAKAIDANPGSFIRAALECARLGHQPGTDDFYFVPIGGGVEGWEGYRGVAKRIGNAGYTVVAEIVYENDDYEYERGTMPRPVHKRTKFGQPRGKMVGAYAYAYPVWNKDAVSKVVEMDEAEIMTHKAASKTASSSDSLWNKWPVSAWLKTVVHELGKWVPTSTEKPNTQVLAGANDKPALTAAPVFTPAQDVTPVPAQAGPVTPRQKMFELFREAGFIDGADMLTYAATTLGREIKASADLTDDDVDQITQSLIADTRP